MIAHLTALLLVTASLVAGGATPPGSAPTAVGSWVPRCDPPAPGTIIADVPWPQQRYDLAAVSQITDGTGVIVAVVDSGVDSSHPQLSASVLAGADMLDRSGDGREDCVGHGTAVASIIAARPTPGIGLRGVAPGVKIVPVRVSERLEEGDGPGTGSVADLATGIRAAVALRPKPAVINLSIATTGDSPALRTAIASAIAADVVVVAAVGNQHERGDPAPFPASYDGIVGVGAIGPDGVRVPTSQVGSYVDIVAPGDVVVGAVPRQGHLAFQGTSFATPFVAATAALIRARWPQLTQDEVVRRLLATADPAPGARPSADYGYGVVNPMRAVTEVLPTAAGITPSSAATAVARPSGVGGGGDDAPTPLALSVAAILVLAAAAVAGIAAAAPLGRRRGWRPGRVDP